MTSTGRPRDEHAVRHVTLPTALMLASYLAWNDVAPSGRPALDLAALEPGLGALVARALVRHGDDEHAVAASIDRWLIEMLGAWVIGWQWSIDDGGPVRTWTNLDETHDDDRAVTASVIASIEEWQSFLVELEALFVGLPGGEGPWLAQDIELAAAALVPVIAERTHAEDAWYRTLARALSWYAESCGHDADVVEPIIRAVIRGRYSSWIEPDPSQTPAVAAELSARLATAVHARPRAIDATALWCSLRAYVGRYVDPMSLDTLRVDGHRRFIATHERACDPERADALDVALDACREAAAANVALDVDLLASWQAIVLGYDVTLRTRDAFAKDGRERYPPFRSDTDDLATR